MANCACGKKIHSKTNQCRACKSARVISETKQKTIGEYRQSISVRGRHPSWIHSHVRLLNRYWNSYLLYRPCFNCGYSLHVELAHIKSISTFDDSAKLSEVNDVANVIPLCPNCHWEFDSGKLENSALVARWIVQAASIRQVVGSSPTGGTVKHTVRRRRAIDIHSKIEWPSEETLAKMIAEKPITHIARDLGVTDNAVRNHCKRRNIALPSGVGRWTKMMYDSGQIEVFGKYRKV